MILNKSTIVILILLLHTSAYPSVDNLPTASNWLIPIDIGTRKNFNAIHWEKDAHFLAKRSAGHLHTGIDIMDATGKSENKVFAAATGKVVSIYADEPHRAIMIQHLLPSGATIYSVYVHVTNIKVSKGAIVGNTTHIADLMTKAQLDIHGWDFNHLHFEILKKPRVHEINGNYLSYSTRCNTKDEVMKHFHNPAQFLMNMWSKKN